mmetsp:Transcript_24884/g.69666  ORF Transcript_24884/g.69666 Transcript_24884/m.69666 type:complete len:213 (+) Transcript_24884:272-910(+)
MEAMPLLTLQDASASWLTRNCQPAVPEAKSPSLSSSVREGLMGATVATDGRLLAAAIVTEGWTRIICDVNTAAGAPGGPGVPGEGDGEEGGEGDGGGEEGGEGDGDGDGDGGGEGVGDGDGVGSGRSAVPPSASTHTHSMWTVGSSFPSFRATKASMSSGAVKLSPTYCEKVVPISGVLIVSLMRSMVVSTAVLKPNLTLLAESALMLTTIL